MSEQTFTAASINNMDDPYADEERPVTRSGMKSVYDQLREDLSAPPVFTEYEVIKVPGKPRIALKISTRLSLKRLEVLRKLAVDKKTKQFDMAEFNASLVVAQTECLQFDGKDSVVDGELVNFKHPGIHESLGALDDRGAVRALIPRDADILDIGQKILVACGYGDGEDEDDVDPLDYENA
jgi:hypothetical protein